LKTFGAWWHHLESTWLLDTKLTPEQVWERISKRVDQNDAVLIVELPKGIAREGWLSKSARDWIEARL
jgi:hypothetical protein